MTYLTDITARGALDRARARPFHAGGFLSQGGRAQVAQSASHAGPTTTSSLSPSLPPSAGLSLFLLSCVCPIYFLSKEENHLS